MGQLDATSLASGPASEGSQNICGELSWLVSPAPHSLSVSHP